MASKKIAKDQEADSWVSLPRQAKVTLDERSGIATFPTALNNIRVKKDRLCQFNTDDMLI